MRNAREGLRVKGKLMYWTLEATHDPRKSFYGKATCHLEDGVYTLQSYDTKVATFDPGEGVIWTGGRYSATTSRHIWEFMHQMGVRLDSEDWGRTVKLTAEDVRPNYSGKIN